MNLVGLLLGEGYGKSVLSITNSFVNLRKLRAQQLTAYLYVLEDSFFVKTIVSGVNNYALKRLLWLLK